MLKICMLFYVTFDKQSHATGCNKSQAIDSSEMTDFPQLNENEHRDLTMGVIIKFYRPSPIQSSIKPKISYLPSFKRICYLFGYNCYFS